MFNPSQQKTMAALISRILDGTLALGLLVVLFLAPTLAERGRAQSDNHHTFLAESRSD